MLAYRVLMITIVMGLLCSCYEPAATRTVYPHNVDWTGTGDYAYGNSSTGVIAALAGQDMYMFWDSGSISVHNDVLAGEFLGAYKLTSVAQTFSLGWHEQSFLHGNLIGQTNNLDLFHTVQSSFSSLAANRIRPLDSLTILQGGERFNVVEICDMATPDTSSGWVLPDSDSSHLLMSIRACTGTGACAGGVIEAAIDSSQNWWWIKNTGSTQHATLKRFSGATFSNECMPIAATRWSNSFLTDSSDEYLFLGDPSTDEVTVFEANNLQNGPLDVISLPPSRHLMDISAEGVKSGAIHFSLVAVLSTNGSAKVIDHLQAVDGNLPTSAFLTESVSTATDKIQSFGRGYRNLETRNGDLLTFGNTVSRKTYRM